ncbi:MAG: D-tyrosyl-tRNA(Tyr) deacylase [Anaerolineales bacterium]|nr:D-tyrosyl-tRNA(Tyr) deacylase [Anaerolineales bacterium]
MRLVVQRVTHGSVTVGGETLGAIGRGLVVLVGVRRGDVGEQADWLAEKTARLRIFEDDAGKLNRSVLDINGAVLAVSQFTLYGDSSGGNRPSFIEAARPEDAEPLITRYIERLRALGVPTETGRFRAEMQVSIHNDGPVTILLER